MNATKRFIISLTLTVLLLGSLVSLACFTYYMPSLADAASYNGKIVFSSSRDGTFEIYLMDGDATNQKRLTNNTMSDHSPSWSPNGTKILFARNNDIYTMDLNGKNARKLVGFAHTPEDLAWSPDGKSILFSAITDGADRDIYVVSAEGGRPKEITKNAASDDFEPSWSPDGKKIAFSSGMNDTDYDIYLMNADGTNRTVIIEDGSNRHPDWSPEGSKLVFASNKSKTYDIFTANADGTNVTRMTNGGNSELYPSWSPDGRKIVFTSAPEGRGEQVYVMNFDGSKLKRLTVHNQKDLSPEFQPLKAPAKEELPVLRENGKILFSTQRQGNSAEIYVMNADGTNATALVSSTDSVYIFPKWSPSGDKISFVGTKDGLEEIVVVNANGTNRTSLMLSTAPFAGLDWSPDGEKIVFAKGDPYHRWIHVINSNSTNLARLTRGNEPDSDPSWSPDGGKIAFSRDLGEGNSEIFVMEKNGAGQRKLTDSPGRDYYPQWSPEGDAIAFVTDKDGNDEIYVMSSNGKTPRNLTNNTADDLYPSWSPDGKKIIFASDRLGDGLDIYAMDVDGKNLARLTSHESLESYPDFGPLTETVEFIEPASEQEVEHAGRPLAVLTPVLQSGSSTIEAVAVGDPLVVAASLTNKIQNQTWESIAILQVRDSYGITQHLDSLEFTVSPGGHLDLGFNWTPEKSGAYELVVFVIDKAQNPEILAEKTSSRITVAERN